VELSGQAVGGGGKVRLGSQLNSVFCSSWLEEVAFPGETQGTFKLIAASWSTFERGGGLKVSVPERGEELDGNCR